MLVRYHQRHVSQWRVIIKLIKDLAKRAKNLILSFYSLATNLPSLNNLKILNKLIAFKSSSAELNISATGIAEAISI